MHCGRPLGPRPVDNDNDGVADEDDVDDLNGNGVIEQIRKLRARAGHAPHQRPATRGCSSRRRPGTKGDYVILGIEGLDNDGDGLVNEDGPAATIRNRNWAADWQPNYVQGGSMDYPFQLPEARAVNDFLMSQPNIAGVQSYHNSGGMILRGPGAESQGEYPRATCASTTSSGGRASACCPYYRYLVIWSGLYTVHGGFIDWTNDGLGILSFSNELWNGGQYFNSPALKDEQRQPDSPITPRASGLFFDDKLEFGERVRRVDAVRAPDVRQGRDGRLEAHLRPPAAALHERGAVPSQHGVLALPGRRDAADARWATPTVEALGDDLWRVRVPIVNDRLIPTILAKAQRNNVVRPDLLTLDRRRRRRSSPPAGCAIGSAAAPRDLIDQQDLSRILVRNGQPGRTTRVIEYLVRGGRSLTLTYDSAKGGRPTVTIPLRATTPE